MNLSEPESEQFFAVYRPLIHWVNQKRSVVPALRPRSWSDPPPMAPAFAIRDELWKDDTLLEEFVTTNPATLPPELLDLAWSWRTRRVGNFTLWKHYQKHSVFFGSDNEPTPCSACRTPSTG